MHHFEKWYNENLKEEMEWQDEVEQESAQKGAEAVGD